MSGVTYSKTWSNGETLTHTDLNANFTAVNTAVGAASGLASLNSSSLVVEDPANATATKAAGKICKWGTSEAFQCSALTATTISGTQITSTIADGTAPFVVTSKTAVANFTASNIAMTGEASTTGSGTITIDVGTVAIGDRIFCQGQISISNYDAGSTGFRIYKSAGTATIVIGSDETVWDHDLMLAASASISNIASSCIVKVTGAGTLTIGLAPHYAGTPSVDGDLYVFFLKKL